MESPEEKGGAQVLDLEAYRKKREAEGTWPLTGSQLREYWLAYLKSKPKS